MQTTNSTQDDKEYYSVKVRKDVVDSTITNGGKVIAKLFEYAVPNLGAGAAEAAVGSAAWKGLSGSNLGNRSLVTFMAVASATSGGKLEWKLLKLRLTI